ncbi:MAG: tripartite tricarboxylate transporter substrate binding protein [Rhizobacter sp.]|nr:tripartite tricarboxylate transporter substrate binding protein [Burkholderiales bacterium]
MSIAKSHRSLFATSLALVAAICVLPTAALPTFPTKPIHFIVPYLPGGTTDIVARTVAQKVSEALGQPVIVENRAGAGGNVGMDAVAKAAADGYTIGFGAISTNALNPHVYKSMAFDPRKDFAAISLLGYSTIVLEVGADTPIKTVADLISAAKKAPGMTYGTAGAGTSMHLAGVLFALTTQTELTHVAYKGSMPGINDMMGGHIKVMFDNLPASLPHIQSGKLRALAVAGAARSPSLPDVPTLAEAGLKGYAVDPWFGVFAPVNVPAAVLQKLNQAFVEALALPEVKEKLLRAGFTPKSSSSAELDALARTEFERLGKIARDARMTAE